MASLHPDVHTTTQHPNRFTPGVSMSSRPKAWCVFGSLVCCLIATGAQAHAAELDERVERLANVETQQAALEQFRDEVDPAFADVLTALMEGALYRWNDRLMILNDDGVFVDLDGTLVLDRTGEPLFPEEGLEQVWLESSNIPLVQQILDFIHLTIGDASMRKSVALRLGNFQEAAVTRGLTRALTQETDPDVQRVMREALHKIRLSDADPQVRLEAATFFSAHRSESALARLKDQHAHEDDTTVHSALEGAITRIERYIRFRSIVGYLFNGLSLSSILLIMSLGLAVTFGLMGIINMAHGEMLMLGSYTAFVVQEAFLQYFPAHQDYYFLVALPMSIVVVGLVGFALERGILKFLYGRPLESLLVTWGIGMLLQQGARLYFGNQTSVSPPTWFRGGWEAMPGLVLPYSRMFIIVLSIVCLVAVYLMIYRSRIGLKIRAVMQNRQMAASMGISTRTVDALTFAMGTALAGIGGCALALIGTVDPEVGKTYIVDSFMVVVLGGVGKLLGTVVAAFGIGMSNKFLEPAIPGTAAAIYAKVGILVLVIFFLQFRPTGIFAAKGRAADVTVR